MNPVPFTLAGAQLSALGSGALWWPDQRCLIVGDLHLGKSDRIARRSGAMLPPYESLDTLARLERDVAATDPAIIVALGDSFDDDAAADALCRTTRLALARMRHGRRWIWIAGNHDPMADGHGGETAHEATLGPLTFRHIAQAGARAEISGHYHPKARLAVRGKLVSRPCFLHDGLRCILPAYGTYTGGLDWTDQALTRLMGDGARAILTGPAPCAVPLPRPARAG